MGGFLHTRSKCGPGAAVGWIGAWLILLVFLGAQPQRASAATTVTYTVDPTRSSLTLSGTVGGMSLRSITAPTNLSTAYGGTITASRDAVADTLQITGASILAENNDSLIVPFSPANYAFEAGTGPFGYLVIADITGLSFSVNSPTIANPSTFDVSQIAATIIAGEMDYTSTPFPTGTAQMMTSLSLNSDFGGLVDDGGVQTLTLPIDADFSIVLTQRLPQPMQFAGHLSGTIVAVAPEPESVTVLLAPALFVFRRRRRSH